MRDSVPSGSYSSVCNVLRQWQSRSSLLIESTDSMIRSDIYIRSNIYIYIRSDIYILIYITNDIIYISIYNYK